MIRHYNYQEAYEKIGCVGPIYKAKQENEGRLYDIHGISISSGQIFVNLYDPEYQTTDYITVEEMAFEWVWGDGKPFGVDE